MLYETSRAIRITSSCALMVLDTIDALVLQCRGLKKMLHQIFYLTDFMILQYNDMTDPTDKMIKLSLIHI